MAYLFCDGTIDPNSLTCSTGWSVASSSDLAVQVAAEYGLTQDEYITLASGTLLAFVVAFGVRLLLKLLNP